MPTSNIAILIPHYNNLTGLNRSLSGISNIEPVDVVIVDDGSKDKPALNDLKLSFPSINNFHLVLLEKNQGIEHALNAGLKFIVDEGTYTLIARLDCGDICKEERFKVQSDFLKENPDVHLVGSWVLWVDPDYKPLYQYELPQTHEEIKKLIYYKDPFVHPAVMFRVSSLAKTGFYPTQYIYCEDTAFFYNFIVNFKTANIPLPLVNCIIDPKGISQSKYRKQKLSRIRFCLDTFSFRYIFMWTLGFAKNVICYLLGNKIPTKLAMLIERKNTFAQ